MAYQIGTTTALSIAKSRPAFAKSFNSTQNDVVFVPGQSVRVNLAGLQVKDVLFHAAVTAAVGTIIKLTSEDPPKYLVKLLFSFRGISEVEVPADRVSPN
jgi:tRNA U34 2-thiouridine synthase MnmA/TrmU